MKTISIEQYDLDIEIYTNRKELITYLDKTGLEERDRYIEDCKKARGYSLMLSAEEFTEIIMLLPATYQEELIDHETIHITWFIAAAIGMPITDESQEFQTYLFTHIKKKIKQEVYGRGKKVATKEVSD